MNKPRLNSTLTQIRRQRAALAKVRAETEEIEDYLAVLEARARDTGEYIPMADVHRRVAASRAGAPAERWRVAPNTPAASVPVPLVPPALKR